MDSPPAPTRRTWVLRRCDEAASQHYAERLSLHPLTARLLLQRGLESAEAMDAFLRPTLAHMHDPFLMRGMREAVALVLEALERGDRITIHGDYDVDGVSSVSVLYEFLSDIGANAGYFIPRREIEGYGLNPATIRRLREEGTQLLITTDCGIANHDEIQLARELGMQAIVVDHHTVPAVLPPANAILNPLQPGCQFPFKKLAAVGVTFNLVVALRSTLRERGIFQYVPEPDLREYLDLVALGTVADVVPLVDENRLFTRVGLEVLTKRKRPGISALIERANVELTRASAQTVSFQLAPRLNAAGRMGDASMCVELLTTRSYARAVELAGQLEELNRERQVASREILRAALIQAEAQVEMGWPILILIGHGWNRGVLGIVASQIMERFHRPAILMGVADGVGKGSARSVEGVDLIQALGQVEELMQTYGGHTVAAGLAVREEHLDAFRTRLPGVVAKQLNDQALPAPRLLLDGELALEAIDPTFLEELAQLGPFGMGNPEPLFLCHVDRVSKAQVVGKRHLRVKLHIGEEVLEGFGYGMAGQRDAMYGPMTIAFTPKRSSKRGQSVLELRLKDARPASAPRFDEEEQLLTCVSEDSRLT